MESTGGHDCVYVSARSGVHDQRWMAALHSLGLNPHHLAHSHYAKRSDFYAAVHDVAASGTPVLAGPLEIAMSLAGATERLILLSWGFDLQEAPASLDLSGLSAVIVDSLANQQIAQTAGARQVLNIPWGVDLRTIDETSDIADLTPYGVSPSERLVMSLRAHEPRYRIPDIIEAFARQPVDARLVIGNSGSMTSEIRQQVDRLGVDAIFLPVVAEVQVPSLLRRASVYVTASEVDGTSVTLLQAMACNVPVVASANAGNVDWIEEGATGFLFPVGDIDRLSRQIATALRGDSLQAQAARAQVESFADWKRNIEKLRPLLSPRD